MRAYPSSQSLFPAQRAFVVQVAATEPGVPDVPLGRAEHVISGTATSCSFTANPPTIANIVTGAGDEILWSVSRTGSNNPNWVLWQIQYS